MFHLPQRRWGLLSLLMTLLAARAFAIEPVLPGVEVLIQSHAEELRGRKLGLMTNPTGVDRRLRSTIDLIHGLPGVELRYLFAPEHGVRGGFAAGESLDDSIDSVTKVPIISMHGASRRPPADKLRELDIVLYDIQDVGVRSYTFISSLAYLMEATEDAGVEVWVLDRPDPLGGELVGGPMMESGNISFIGVHTIPHVYGLTPGEFARLYKLEKTPNVELKIIEMQGWRRGMNYGELGWVWVPPSEHIPHWETCHHYAVTGIMGELGVISEGVGTPNPFEQFGAPWYDAWAGARELNGLGLDGVQFRPTQFRPRYGTHKGEMCNGIQVHIMDAKAFDPSRVGLEVMQHLATRYRDRGLFAARSGSGYDLFMKALGDSRMAEALSSGGEFEAVHARTREQLASYLERRAKALIYP